MFRVYAVDPEAYVERIADALFRESFCFERGRLISCFPTNWKEEVFKRIISSLPEGGTRAAMIDYVQKKFRVFAIDQPKRVYGEGNWYENAERAHRIEKFAAIICRERIKDHDACLTLQELSDEDPRWRSNPDDVIPRTQIALGKSAQLLIENSREIIFLDPYFLHGNEKLDRWIKSLSEFLRLVFCRGAEKARVEIHLRVEGHVPLEGFKDRLRDKEIHRLVPPLKELRIVRWTEFPDGDEFHARYILTELGGLRYDAGLDHKTPKKTTDVSRVGRAVHERRRKELEHWELTEAELSAGGIQPAFRFQDAVIIQNDGQYIVKTRQSGIRSTEIK